MGKADVERRILRPVEGDGVGALAAGDEMRRRGGCSGLARLDQRKCPVCSITFLEFRKQGRLGCPHDYEFFSEELEPLLMNIHDQTHHIGKVPKRCPQGADQKTQLIRLRREMKEAIASENYERASQLRDEIRATEAEARSLGSAGDEPAAN